MTETIQTGGRRSGRTTEQIRTAPPAAIYVCHSAAAIQHDQEMARRLWRQDILFTTLGGIGYRAGEIRRHVVFDHSVTEAGPIGRDRRTFDELLTVRLWLAERHPPRTNLPSGERLRVSQTFPGPGDWKPRNIHEATAHMADKLIREVGWMEAAKAKVEIHQPVRIDITYTAP